MDCSTCKDKKIDPVPYIVHEADMARAERTIKRLWALVLVVILLLVGTNAGWLWYESQFEIVTETTTQEVWQETDNGGVNRFVGGDYYGDTADSDNYN